MPEKILEGRHFKEPVTSRRIQAAVIGFGEDRSLTKAGK
jgi:hypothetical protein